MDIEIKQLGERAIAMYSLSSVSIKFQRRIWWVAKQLETKNLLEIIPGMNNLTLIYDPLEHDREELRYLLYAYWQASSDVTQLDQAMGKQVNIQVKYGGEDGPDLTFVAKYHKLSIDEVVAIHTKAIYTVYFLGFLPGFAYLGGMNSRICTPRRSEPRLQIPKGSVGIGGEQTGIYPSTSPGGWQLIGRTEMELFDSQSEQPSLLLPGDKLCFKVQEIAYD